MFDSATCSASFAYAFNVKPRLARLLCLAVVIWLALFTTAVAQAEPQDDNSAAPTAEATPAPPAEAPPTPPPEGAPDAPAPPAEAARVGTTRLSLLDLGSTDTIAFIFDRDVTDVDLGFAVPPGLKPVALTARLQLPVPVRFGSLDITQDDRTISHVNSLPADGSELVIPLAGVQVFGNWANITMTMTAIPPEDYCWDYRSPIRLVDSSVAFDGNSAIPTSVSTFLPPTLRKLTLVLPEKPSRAESDAAVQLAATVQRRYRANLDVSVIPYLGPPPPPPSETPLMDRTIIVKEGPDPGLTLENGGAVPTLRISGSGDDLANQARLLGDESLPSAVSSKAVAGPLSYNQEFAADITTITEMLHKTGLSNEGVWPAVQIPLDQTLFGHSISQVLVHLIGSYTPIPQDFGGEVTVSVRDYVVDRWPVDRGGTIDRSIAVPNQLLDRSTNLVVGIRINGDMGHCGDYPAMNLRIDGDSEIKVSPADPPIPAGFRSFPQTLLPRVRVGIGADAFADTARAARIIAGLQQASGVPLATVVTSLDEVIASRDSAVLIASQGWTNDKISLPVSAGRGRFSVAVVDSAGKETALNLDSASPVGSLQTVLDRGRSLLVATSNGNPQQLDALLQWLSAERGRWGALDGRAVIAVPDREPVTVPNPDFDLTPREAKVGTWSTWWVRGVIVVIACAAVGAAAILVRSMRLRARKS